MKLFSIVLTALLSTSLMAGAAYAAGHNRSSAGDGMGSQGGMHSQDSSRGQADRDRLRDRDRDHFPGYNRMNAQEREQYQNQMRNARTQQERDRIRNEYQQRLNNRPAQ